MARAMAFLFAPPAGRDPKAEAKFLGADSLGLLHEVRQALAKTPCFSAEALETLCRELAERHGRKLVEIAQPIRVALTGTTASPPLFPILALLGREVVLERLAAV
jgi:glutamyl-tRNA synthetase